MTGDDLSITIFIIGTAIGNLGWYIVFRYLHGGRAQTPKPYEQFFNAILAISSLAILVFFLTLMSILGPSSLFLYSANRWTVSLPLGTLLLGILFGGIGAEWVRYIINPPLLKTLNLRTAHKRWGYFLAGLLFIGLVLPILPRLLAPFESASITTPIASLSLAKQNSWSTASRLSTEPMPRC